MTSEPEKFEIHLPIEKEGESAVDLLAAASGFSKQRVKQVMKNGAVWLTHQENTRRLRRAKRALAIGSELHFYYDETIQAAVPKTPELIADQGDYSVFFKPQGMYSQGSKWGDQCTINRWVEQNMDRPAFVVHRLDRAAMGLMLIAHTKTAAAKLSALFERRLVEKKYRTRVIGKFEPASMVFDNDIEGRTALSRANLLEFDADNNCSLLEVEIETGRKHQIRRHLAEAGYPILGDRLYGTTDDKNGTDQKDQACKASETEGPTELIDLQLVATDLSFVDPFVEAPSQNVYGNKDASVERVSYCAPSYLLPKQLCKPQMQSEPSVWPSR
ncbi:MAG: RNA pseudouridine synthase [Pseudomonadales bacterium]|nr:RNA pseudouridine synthase [Pseudomonadales bacterium]